MVWVACNYSQLISMYGGAERSSGPFAESPSQQWQSEDEDAESIAEKLDIFPPSRSGYTQKVRVICRLPACHRRALSVLLACPQLSGAPDRSCQGHPSLVAMRAAVKCLCHRLCVLIMAFWWHKQDNTAPFKLERSS